MPKKPLVEISLEEQTQILAALRRARYGYLLALHILLWCAAGRNPTEIAAVLFCSRSSVYRTVRTTVLVLMLRRSLVALLKASPRAYGWCRTRWSCATLALTWQAQRGVAVSAETRRRWLHEVGWVWKRPNLVAKDDAPHRIARLARLRDVFEPCKRCEAMVFADELDIHLWPKVGAAWMPQGTQLAVMTPGTHETYSLAGALDLATGTLRHCCGPRNTNERFQQLLQTLDEASPAPQFQRVYVVVDHDKIHKAKAVEQSLANHPRVTRLLLPTSCPRAHSIEHACGDVHDLCTRHHTRKRLRTLGADVEAHLYANGPWPYKLSKLYDEPAVTAAVEHLATEEHANIAA